MFSKGGKRRPRALRHLALQELGLVIQEGEHSSVDDARAGAQSVDILDRVDIGLHRTCKQRTSAGVNMMHWVGSTRLQHAARSTL